MAYPKTSRHPLPVFGLAVGLVAACSTDTPGRAAGPPANRPASEIVATIAGEALLMHELEATAAGELAALANQRQKILEGALEQLLEQRLLQREATRRGTTVEALVASEVTAKLEPVTEAAIVAWYEANRARVRQPLEQVKEPIQRLLGEEQRQQQTRQLLAELGKRFVVRKTLPVMRHDVFVADAPAKGPANAAVTLVEFSDFECPFCRTLLPEIEAVSKRYPDQLRIVFRHYPLSSIHPRAEPAARAAVCAEEQGKFWPLHDLMFERQTQLGDSDITAYASEAGLDPARFASCFAAESTRARVARDVVEAEAAGVGSTPSLFVNGRPLTIFNNRPAADQIADLIEDELARAAAPVAPARDGAQAANAN